MGRISMGAVARRAGVSIATVSRALGGARWQVATVTREAVERAASELGYQRDPALQALISYRRGVVGDDGFSTVAVVSGYGSVRNRRIGFFIGEEYLSGLYERFRVLGFKVERFDVGAKLERSRGEEVRRILISRGIRSVVFAPLGPRGRLLDLPFPIEGFTVVGFGHWAFRNGLHSVGVDHSANMQEVMRRLQAAGWRRVGFVARRHLEWGQGDALCSAYLGQQRQLFALDEQIPPLYWGGNTEMQLRGWLTEHRPQVVIVQLHDHIERMRGMGLRIPGAFHVVNVSMGPGSSDCGIQLNARAVGHEAAEMLQMLLQRGETGRPPVPLRTLIRGQWTGGYPSMDFGANEPSR
jgi:LacI family transcriptional regulator